MNKRSVNISSLVILLSLLCFIAEICLYYFIPQHYICVLAAIIFSLALSHFFLVSSLNYDYTFLHAAFMMISTTIFTSVIYFIQPNHWISYDYFLILLIEVHWLIPFLYSCCRDLFDRGPRFSGYHTFFHRMCILFSIIYLVMLVKEFYLTPILPPYHAIKFGAHNFVPFMATASYIESSLRHGTNLLPLFSYLFKTICIGIPFGFFARVYTRKLPFLARIFLFLVYPFILELIQYLAKVGRADIDDYCFNIIGIILGVICFYSLNWLFQVVTKRDYMMSRNTPMRHFY